MPIIYIEIQPRLFDLLDNVKIIINRNLETVTISESKLTFCDKNNNVLKVFDVGDMNPRLLLTTNNAFHYEIKHDTTPCESFLKKRKNNELNEHFYSTGFVFD